MADPISALGTAAAAVQFGDVAGRAILESIKLLKNLNETPKRMAQQLQDVTKSIERMVLLRSTILAPGSSVFIRLTSQQLKRIDEAVSDTDVAMKSLHQSLQRLFPRQTSNADNTIKSFWRAVVSVTREKDIEEKIQRINRIHQELMQELQVTDLELHTSVWDLNSRMFSTVETSLRDSQASQDTWKVAGDLLQNTADLTRAEVARVRNNTASMATLIDGLKMDLASLSLSATQTNETALATQQELGGLRLDFSTFQRLFSAEIDAKLLQEREHNRVEILSLRDALLRMITGDKSNSLGQEFASATYLPESSKRHLGAQVQNQLLHCPSTLRQVADNSIRTVCRGLAPILQCYCRPSQNLVTVRRGVFRFGYERYAQHDPHCPFYQSNVRSWSYTLTIRLLPFLNKTVALALGATFGAGAWAMVPPLKFYATTDRAKSSLFSEFDRFARVCGRPRHSQTGVYLHKYWDLEWDLAKVVPFLNELIKKLSRSFQNGTANGSDTDESGCTMLHEILLLITVLGPRCNSLTVQLHELLRLAFLSGVDKFARTETFPLNWKNTRGYVLWVTPTESPSLTAMEILLGQMFIHSSLQNDIPAYDTIKRFNLEDTASWDNVIDQGASYLHKDFTHRSETPLKFIREYPEFTEQLECGELAAPILRQSIDGLRRAIISPNCNKFLESEIGTFHPLKLAVGWPDGIKILLEEECFTMEAIELAICTNDIESLEITLSDWSEHPSDWWSQEMVDDWLANGLPSSYRMILERASSCGRVEVDHCVVRYLNMALPRLNGIDIEYVGTAEEIEPPISGKEYSRCGSHIVYMRREIESIERPIPLDTNNISVYHFWDGWEGATKLLDTLYESGLTAIDLKNGDQETPLLYRLSRLRGEFVPESIMWFLQKGANPNFDAPHCWPNIHFYLPLVMSFNKANVGRREITSPFYSSLCNPLQPDGCQCYCSSHGCLSFRQTLTCRVTKGFPRWHLDNCLRRTRVKSESLEDWARINSVESSQMATLYTETCRLEVFDRLGMAHTCCNIGIHCNETSRGLVGEYAMPIWMQRFPDDERGRLQDEDSELREQLDLIMEAYIRMRETYSGSFEGFWEWWWQTLDDILPDLLPEERCKLGARDHEYYKGPLEEQKREQEIYEKRARREKEALRNSGYFGLKFTDIIRLHFKEYLS